MRTILFTLLCTTIAAVPALLGQTPEGGGYDTPAPPVPASWADIPASPAAPFEPTPPPAYQAPAPAETIPVRLSDPATPVAHVRVAPARPTTVADRTARLQIFLDQKQFGPGKIDGAPGEFTAKALLRYRRANGLPIYDDPNYLDDIPLDDIHPVYTTYTITEADLKQIGNVPAKPKDQAKLKRMPYSSLLKFLSERYHSDPNFLRSLNPTLSLDHLQPGDVVRVPNVKPFKIEDVKAVAKAPKNPAHANRRVVIDTREKILDLYDGNTLLASFPITPGSSKLPAPAGSWRVVGIATMPWFRWDEGVLKRGVRTDDFHNIPAGPSNPVGVVWIGLNRRSIGLHGTNNPQTIGRASSHGCIRLANWDAIRLANMISPGTSVIIDNHAVAENDPEVKVSQTGR